MIPPEMSATQKREQRRERILSYTNEELTGYYFPTAKLALEEAKRIIDGGKRIAMWDVDDTLLHSEPWLRAALNKIIRDRVRDFTPVDLNEVLAAGGRYYQVARYQSAAIAMGTTFSALYNEVAQSEEIHANMMPTQSRQALQLELCKMGFEVAGYPTARPQELARVTAGALKHFGFSKAPVIDVVASSADPSSAKVNFFKRLSSEMDGVEIPSPILFIDDHVPTAIALKKHFPGFVEPVVTLIHRNRNEIHRLETSGVLYGEIPNLAKMIKSRLAL